jgi:NAD(P)-dependent dehydrogenase (short-subunit alcohol dehydrogenase family)/carbon monoxide dehydrogenase subunit G
MDNSWRVKKEIDVAQPADRVFEYLSNWDSVIEWDPSVVSACIASSGKPAVGSRFGLTLRFGWKRVPMTYTITCMKPHQRLELEGSGPQFKATDRIRLEEIPSGTRLTYTVEVTFERASNRLTNLIGRHLFDRYAEKSIRRLRTMLSGSTKPPYLTGMTRLSDQAILPGLIGFTRIGYTLAKGRRPVASTLYSGRTMVLTGGTSGIGKAAARELYSKGVHLVVVGRDADKLKDLRGELASIRGGGRIATELADLSSLTEVRQLAARLVHRHRRIDALINNAGSLFNRYRQTDEGIEMTLATDLVSPYLLTRLLLPSLKAATAARIINVASGGMYTQGMRADAFNAGGSSHDGPTAYARAKRGLVILTELWAKELAAAGIGVHAMHPGWVDTPGLRKSLPSFHRQLSPWLRTPSQGADTIVWLAASPDAQRASGRFWLDRKIRATHVFRHTRTSPRDNLELLKAMNQLSGLAQSAKR